MTQISLERRRWWPANKAEESNCAAVKHIFSLCHCEMHKNLTVSTAKWIQALTLQRLMISATVWSGKQHVHSKTKTHTLPFLFVCLWISLPLWQSLPFPFSFPSHFPSLTLTECLTCLSFLLYFCSILPSLPVTDTEWFSRDCGDRRAAIRAFQSLRCGAR